MTTAYQSAVLYAHALARSLKWVEWWLKYFNLLLSDYSPARTTHTPTTSPYSPTLTRTWWLSAWWGRRRGGWGTRATTWGSSWSSSHQGPLLQNLPECLPRLWCIRCATSSTQRVQSPHVWDLLLAPGGPEGPLQVLRHARAGPRVH